MTRRTLVTGGVRSGKSRHAESLLSGESAVTYVAPGPKPDPSDPEWAERVAAHRRRRPAHWSTLETPDVAGALRAVDGAVLVDCLGTWVSALLDELDAWDASSAHGQPAVDERVGELVEAWSHAPGPAVAVTNEVGMGVVPAHRSGRVFRDVLGQANREVAAASEDVALVVAGRVLLL